MADSQYVQLAAGMVTTVTLAANHHFVEIVNRDGSAEVFLTFGTLGNPPVDPAVAGNGTLYLPAAVSGLTLDGTNGDDYAVVKLISSGTPKIFVRGWS